MRKGIILVLGISFCIDPIFADGQKLFEYNFSRPLQTAPAVDLDGAIFVGGKGAVAAVGPAGTELWETELSSGSQSDIGAITVGSNEVYVTSSEGLFAFSKAGTKLWGLAFDCSGSAVALGSSNDLFVGDASGHLHAIRGSSEQWSKLLQPTFGPVLPLKQPVIANDGTIHVNVGTGEIFAVNTAGDKLWSTPVSPGLNVSPIVGEDGTVYVPNPSSVNFVLAALKPDGSALWSSVGLDGKVAAPPVMATDGSIYIPTTPNQFQTLSGLIALNANGSTNWSFNVSSDLSPAIALDGTILVAGIPFTRSQFGTQFSPNKVIYALRADGTTQWSYTNDVAVAQGLAIGKSGAIYAAQTNGVLLALSGSSPVSDKAWPIFGRDPKHTFEQRVPVTLNILPADQISDTSARFSADINPAGVGAALFF